jgi:hypothetical protein
MMDKEALAAEIKRRLRLDPETGKLFWLPRPVSDFDGGKYPAGRLHRTWTTRFSGQEALNSPIPSGHLAGSVSKVSVYAHQAVWVLHHGAWPVRHINHIDGDPANNRPPNLRLATQSEVTRNMPIHKDNTSGVSGVHFRRDTEKWQARVVRDGVVVQLGCYAEKDDAARAVQMGYARAGFHPNHGKRLSRRAEHIAPKA